jgi:hypothetical protein
MNKTLPDKWIRKAISELIDGIIVDGITIPCYDTRVSGPNNPDYYVLMTTQTNEVDKATKCEWFWESNILLDVVTIYPLPGNPGSRLLADEILEAVKDEMNNLVLDASSGLSIITQTQSYPNDLNLSTESEVVYRKFLNLELLIK